MRKDKHTHRLLMLALFPLLLCHCGGKDEGANTNTEADTTTTATDTVRATAAEPIKHCTLYEGLKKSRTLRDPNKMHILTGREMGLKEPFRKNADFLAVRDSIVQNGILIYVEDGAHFKKKEMSHSYPYLTKETVELVNEISDRFHQKLMEKKLNSYSLLLTSCLRTLESQNALRNCNLNATRDTTSHAFGASFDLSYWDFLEDSTGNICRYKNLQKILTQTIREVRNEKKCLVIKETGQFCFHCTTIR